MCLRPFGLYCSACLGILFVSILCVCCSHFSWYCFISFTIFCAPVFSLIHWLFSLSSFVIRRRCLKNFICAASKHCSSLFFSTQASLPNFNAALVVILSICSSQSNLIFYNFTFSLCHTYHFNQVDYSRIRLSLLAVCLISDIITWPEIQAVQSRLKCHTARKNQPSTSLEF